MRKQKLVSAIRCGHLGDFLRVDLVDPDNLAFGSPQESVAFRLLEAKNGIIKFKILHLIYDDKSGAGYHTKESHNVYELDLNKDYKNDKKFIKVEEE